MGLLTWWWKRADVRLQSKVRRALELLLPPVPPPTDAELGEAWNRVGPGVEVRARHILLQAPEKASQAQRDEIRRQAQDIRARAKAGEDFATLARTHSADGSAVHGGDLGYFGHGRMVPAFEQVAFSLRPGEISGVVETPFGLHVIKLEDRRRPELHDKKEQFRDFLIQRERQLSFRTLVDGLATKGCLRVEAGAEQIVRDLARRPMMWRWSEAAHRPLVSYRGGRVTAADLIRAFATLDSKIVATIVHARDEALRELLKNQALRNLVLAEAHTSGTRSRSVRRTWPWPRSDRVSSAPGARLLWLADFLYSRKSLDNMLAPAVDDMRYEYFAALSEGRSFKAKWVRVRGTWDFLRTAGRLTAESVGGVIAWLWKLFF